MLIDGWRLSNRLWRRGFLDCHRSNFFQSRLPESERESIKKLNIISVARASTFFFCCCSWRDFPSEFRERDGTDFKREKKRIWKFKATIERTHDGINWWTPAVRIFFLITPFCFFGGQLKREGSKNPKNAKWTDVDAVVVIIDHIN